MEPVNIAQWGPERHCTTKYQTETKASEPGTHDKKRQNHRQSTGAPPEKVQIRNAGTIFVTVAPGNDVMLVRPNQTRPWAIVTAAGNFLTL